MKKGKLTSNGVHLQPHEYHTIRVLLEKGHNVELMVPSMIKYQKMPDVLMDGVLWEIKAPEGAGKNTIKHNFQSAVKQCENVLIDLFRCGIDEISSLKELAACYNSSKRIRRLRVITKSETIIDIRKQKGVK